MTRRTAQQHEVTAGAHEVLGGPLHGMRAGGLVIDGDHDVAQRVLVDNLVRRRRARGIGGRNDAPPGCGEHRRPSVMAAATVARVGQPCGNAPLLGGQALRFLELELARARRGRLRARTGVGLAAKWRSK